MVSQFNNELQSNHVSPSRNQLAGMVSEPLGKGINKLVIPRKTEHAELARNRQPLVNGAYCRVSSL